MGQAARYFFRALPAVVLFMLQGGSLPAQQKTDTVIVFSPYERFLNIQAEYRGAVISGDSALIAEKSYLMGKRYYDFGDYYEARKWFFKSLKLRGRNGESVHLAKIYNWLARCEEREGNWTETMRYAQLALAYCLKPDNNDPDLHAGLYMRVGEIHLGAWKEKKKTGSFTAFVPSLDSSLWYLKQARRHKTIKGGGNIAIATLTRFSGEILSEMGQYEAAMDSMQRALDIFAVEGPLETFNVAATAQSIGEVLINSGRLEEAGSWLRKAHAISDTSNTRSYMALAEVKKRLSDYYAKTGNWQEAYRLNLEAGEISSREVEAYRKGSREGLELMHENDLKMAELEASRRELKLEYEKAEVRSQLQWIIGSALLLTLAAGIVLYRLYRKYKAVSIEHARLVKEQSHRVKNNLQSVYNLLSLQMGQLSDPLAVAALEESLSRVDAITRVHRRLYEGNRLAEVELAGYVRDLVKGILRSYEMERSVQLYEIPEIWLHADKAIPLGLMISELVTNSCKYAFQEHPAPALKIKCMQDLKGNFNLEYSDNGPGFQRSGATSSFGLKLIGLLAGQLKGEYAFSRESGSVFRLKFKEALKKAATSS